MSPALKLEAPDWCDELDEAQVADYAAGAARRLFQFDAALAAVRTDPAAVVELMRVLQSLASDVARFGFHALGRQAHALQDPVLRASGGPARGLFQELAAFRTNMAEAFAEARRQALPEPVAQDQDDWFMPPLPPSPRWHLRRLVLAVLESRPSLVGAAAGTTLARAGTHLVCTGGAAAQAYRESCGDGVVLGFGGGALRAEQFSDLTLHGTAPRSALLAATADGAVLCSCDDQSLADARALLLAGKPVAQVISSGRAHGALNELGPGRLLRGADPARAALALLVELSRDDYRAPRD